MVFAHPVSPAVPVGEQHEVWHEEAQLSKGSAGLQGAWSCRLTRMNTAKTACALFQCAQLWSAAACTAPLCEWGKMFSEASSGTKCYRECNPFPAEVWLAQGVPSMPKLPTVSSSHAATQLHPKPGVKEITVACCSCLIRGTDALGSLKFSPAAVLPWWCRFWLQSSSHLLATRAVLLLLARVMWVQTPVLILLFCGDSRRFFLPELLIWKINREVFL